MPIYLENRKAHFNYEIKETFEAGVKLLGFEVKSIKNGQGNINSAFSIVRGGEAFVVGMNIPPYQPNNTDKEYNPERTRKLLLSKKEIKKLAEIDNKKGLTLIILSLYSKGPFIKVSIGVGRGKKSYNKKETIKERDLDREMEREYKR